uniref:Uncharacterized protein n=1 Tax=Odontella aurita TaxID=265563 RepID=A0A7S4K9V4_9STRA
MAGGGFTAGAPSPPPPPPPGTPGRYAARFAAHSIARYNKGLVIDGGLAPLMIPKVSSSPRVDLRGTVRLTVHAATTGRSGGPPPSHAPSSPPHTSPSPSRSLQPRRSLSTVGQGSTGGPIGCNAASSSPPRTP